MSHSDICKHCLEGWGEHEAMKSYCPKYDDGGGLYFDKSQTFERLNIRDVMSELSQLQEERKNQADKYNDLRNLIQRFHQTLIARNYNNIGKWHNERQEYNYELISEVEAILTSKS